MWKRPNNTKWMQNHIIKNPALDEERTANISPNSWRTSTALVCVSTVCRIATAAPRRRALSHWRFANMTQLNEHWKTATWLPFKDIVHVHCLWDFVLSNCIEKVLIAWQELGTGMISVYGRSGNSPCRQETLIWHSCHWDIAVVRHLRPSVADLAWVKVAAACALFTTQAWQLR